MLQEIKTLVQTLNEQRDAYYNKDSPKMTDKEYDRLFDRLEELEKKSGIIFSNSPMQSVGYYPVSELAKVRHTRALLSLEKTKQIRELADFMENQDTLLMLKLDGLTVKLVYEEGRLVQASTRGDGNIGEDITHNIPAFENIPLSISYRERLVTTGEAFIYKDDFRQLEDTIRDGNGEPYKNARNLASGSVRNLNPEVCKGRHVHFIPFNVLEGMDEGTGVDSREFKLMQLGVLGFDTCPYVYMEAGKHSEKELKEQIEKLKTIASEKEIHIDGLVLIYDNLSYSSKCGKTGHHYKDGLAYKFEDETYETTLQEIKWTPSRSGDLAPVAVFDSVEIDGADVSRASLHNLSFIKNLELVPGCRILVSKRNMIIPHIEDNLDRGFYYDTYPLQCPCCGSNTRIRKGKMNKGNTLETLYCDNPECDSQILKKYVHFVAKKAMDISGISESNLRRFLECGWLISFQDIYHLDRYRKEIVALDRYGEKSYERLWAAINESRNTDFMDKYNDELKMQFSAYVKQSILNRRGQYLRKKYRIESLEVNYEEYLSVLKQDTEELFGKIEKLSGKVFSEIVESRLLLEQIEDYQLLQALITLSEEQKKVILLRIFYEKTFREIDWILGFPEKKAENTYYNAIKKLRKLMGGKRHGV